MPKTSRDYVTRLKFLASTYKLDKNISEDYIDFILSEEEKNMIGRKKYSSKHSLSDFKSGLRKFLAFIHSDYHKKYEDSIISKIDNVRQDKHLDVTQKASIIQSRIGQGYFRSNLIHYWNCCAVSGFTETSVLMASHIKPWRVSDNEERLDLFNGLLLLPNYDKLFDLGYITFDQFGRMICSKLLSSTDKEIIGICTQMHLLKVDERHKPYLKYHNEYCFMG